MLALCDRFGVAAVAPSLVGSMALRWMVAAEHTYQATARLAAVG